MSQLHGLDRKPGSRARLILVLVLGGLLIFPVAFVFVKKLQIQARLDAISENGDPICIADLEPPPVDPITNAATFIERMELDGSVFISEVWPILGEGDFDWNVALPAEDLEIVSQKFADYSNLFHELDSVYECTQFALPLDYSQATTPFMDELLSWMGKTRTVSRLSTVNAKYLSAQGKYQQATDVCLNQLRLCRLQDAGVPMVIGFLMNMACRSSALDGLREILLVADLPESSHMAIEAELAQHDAMNGVVYALITERAFGIESFSEMPFFASLQIEEYLDAIEQQLSLGAEPLFTVGPINPVSTGSLVGMAVGALVDVRIKMDEYRARIRRLRVLNALEDSSRDTTAAEVDFELLGIPREATVDPRTGNPFRIERGEEHWFVGS